MSIDNATPEEWDRCAHAAQTAVKWAETGFSIETLNAHLVRPFGEVALVDRCLAFALFQQGHSVEVVPRSGQRTPILAPVWDRSTVYQIRLKPEEVVLPSIDWSHVAPYFKWLVQDEDGTAYLIDRRPIGASPGANKWSYMGVWLSADHFASFRPGIGNWRKMIVERPR